MHVVRNEIRYSINLVPRPHPQGGKGSGLRQAFSGCYLWYICDCHMTPHL